MSQISWLILLLTSVFTCSRVSGQTINPCALPSSCFSGERAGYPGDCQTYYECSFLGVWTNKTCVTGQQFDSVSLTCVSTGLATCQPPCDLPTGSTTTVSTLAPIMCDSSTSGSSCNNQGDRVADVSDCLYYFQCLSSTWNRMLCSPSGFIFDIDSASCVPASQAHCDYRCQTPAPTSPTSPTPPTTLPTTTTVGTTPTPTTASQTTSPTVSSTVSSTPSTSIFIGSETTVTTVTTTPAPVTVTVPVTVTGTVTTRTLESSSTELLGVTGTDSSVSAADSTAATGTIYVATTGSVPTTTTTTVPVRTSPPSSISEAARHHVSQFTCLFVLFLSLSAVAVSAIVCN